MEDGRRAEVTRTRGEAANPRVRRTRFSAHRKRTESGEDPRASARQEELASIAGGGEMNVPSAAILLVPGFLGFTKIGSVSYFDAVKKLLATSSGVAHVFDRDTLPTGALWHRVAKLHRNVEALLHAGYAPIHLIGHSTGGVDVRLLTNDAYLWPGGPSGEAREAMLSAIGRVVTISAPHHGAPIALAARGGLPGGDPVRRAREHPREGGGERIAPALAPRPLRALAAAVAKGIWPDSRIAPLLRGAGLSAHEARDASRYLASIVADHPLADELTPPAMRVLNEHVAGGRQLPVSSFVTVSPPPSLPGLFRFAAGVPLLATPLQRIAYALAYENALPCGAPLPKGPWIGPEPDVTAYAERAEDGVVPAASQALKGEDVAGLVYGDHLDVVGHYDGEHGGETLFDSGADFDDARMKGLWTAIGALVGGVRAQRSPLGPGAASPPELHSPDRRC